ncbi:MAG: competence/damage-inducible protein A [Promethearchaeota archaeon]
MILSKHPNRAEILLIGNELLIGKTKDTNGAFLVDKLVRAGYVTSKIVVIPDELDIISGAIQDALSRAPKCVLTSGGLGPTFDDMTLKGVAMGVAEFLGGEVPLELNEVALEMVRQRYARSKHETIARMRDLNPARMKMAYLPRGGKPVRNPVGSAPGVELKVGDTTIYCLPGVPRELESMFVEEILPRVKKMAQPVAFFEGSFLCRGVGESNMAARVTAVQERHPEVYVKSHPRLVADLPVELHVTSFESQEAVDAVIGELRGVVEGLGGSVDGGEDQ